jgi:hypothetical protein
MSLFGIYRTLQLRKSWPVARVPAPERSPKQSPISKQTHRNKVHTLILIVQAIRETILALSNGVQGTFVVACFYDPQLVTEIQALSFAEGAPSVSEGGQVSIRTSVTSSDSSLRLFATFWLRDVAKVVQ